MDIANVIRDGATDLIPRTNEQKKKIKIKNRF